MSFAKIAEARAVKKIVAFIRQQAKVQGDDDDDGTILRLIADDIEDGFWKDIKLPKPKKKNGKS